MKECELCKLPARMYCESDQASLCWDCDVKVHSANFLVARHTRSILCHVCRSPTPWQASGTKLGHTVSVCDRCVDNCSKRQDGRERIEASEGGNDDENDFDEEDDSNDEGEDEDESDGEIEDDSDDEEDGENQVVPWSSTPPPPLVSSSSSEESSSSKFCTEARDVAESSMAFSLKRMRENADLSHQDDIGCSSSQLNTTTTTAVAAATAAVTRPSADDEVTSVNTFRPLKRTEVESRSSAMVESLKRFRQNVVSGGGDAEILDICKLCKDPRAVDLVSNDSHNPPI